MRTPSPNILIVEFYQIFEKEILSVLDKNIPEKKKWQYNSFYEGCITFIPNPVNNIIRRDNYRTIFLNIDVRNPHKVLQDQV